jgi:acetoin utilization deacetylase AcuC-like enzyme
LLCRERGLRVAIFDFDVHHGDGTQLAHLRDPDVLFISVHRYGLGFYPGSGAASEQGVGAGQGATLNLPLFAGADGAAVLEAFCDRALPKLIDFAPDILLVSAGFDGHQDDPLSDAMLDDASYQQLCKRLADAAATICQGRWMGILEGGYHLQALSRGVCALVGAMAGVTAKQASDE